jgi:hypothetical protein
VTDVTNDWEVAGGNLVGNTLVRQHWRILFNQGASTIVWSYGIIVGRPGDISNNNAALDPGGVNSRDLEWIWNDRHYFEASGATVNSQEVATFDIRAQRKMRQLDDRLLLCVKCSVASATYIPYCRALMKV